MSSVPATTRARYFLGKYLLVALWALSAGLTGLEAFGIVGFAYPAVGVLVRALTWLLVFWFRPQLGRRWFVCLLWLPLLGSFLLGILTFFWGGFYLLGYLLTLVGGADTYWHTTQVLARRGAVLYVTQQSYERPMRGDHDERQRVLVPLTGWFHLLLPPDDFAVARWTPVNRPAIYFLADSTQQLQRDRVQQQQRQCACRLRALDSLDRLHRLPAAVLPAATQRGANTVGCLLQGQVWRNHLGSDSLGACPQNPGYAFRVYNGRSSGPNRDTDLRITAQRGVLQQLYVQMPYPLPATPGAWPVKVTFAVQVPGASAPTCWVSRAQSVTLTLTYIGPYQHLLAGTFSGTLYAMKPGRTQGPTTLALRQGRFDVSYDTWVEN